MLTAAKQGGMETIHALLAAGAQINATDKHGRTPLMHAANYHNSAAVQSLLAAGADVRAKTKHGWTALRYATQRSDDHAAQTIKLLLAADAGENPAGVLLAAALACDRERIQSLLAAGVQVDAKNIWNDTALMHAAGSEGSAAAEAVQLLLAAGACVGAQNNVGETALMWA
ncbi:MAG: ankyrin repeat domain-containing protein, partial [Rhodocyclaceae bacterium]|nr:ankyrin repeat domain-containing protein [Rhodocyclaceae bacterium]